MKSSIQSLIRRARNFEIAAALGMGAAAWANGASDIREGQDLAAKVCSPCHAVAGPPGLSLSEIAKGTHAAPDALRALRTSTQTDVESSLRDAKPGIHRAADRRDFGIPRQFARSKVTPWTSALTT